MFFHFRDAFETAAMQEQHSIWPGRLRRLINRTGETVPDVTCQTARPGMQSQGREAVRFKSLHSKVATILLSGTCLTLGAPALAQSTGSATDSTAPAKTETPDIVVTASKRAERLMDTPIAISVVSSKLIVQQNLKSFQDYASLVPSLNQAGGLGAGSGTIILRGLNTGPQSLTNTTAVYLGDTPFTPQGSFAIGAFQTPDPDLVDVDHIEVLKGPQGTLYGASSLGGLIRIIPKEADVDATAVTGNLRAGASVAEGGDYGYDVRGSVYGALVPGKLAIGVSGFARREPGFITNKVTGTDNLGRVNAYGGSITLAYRPFDDLTIRGRFLLENERQIGQIYQQDIQGTNTPQYGTRTQSQVIDQYSNPDYRLFELSADYKTPIGTLTATLSHTYTQLSQSSDYTSSYNILTPDPANDLVIGTYAYQTRATNEELRFASNKIGPFEFLLGAYHTYQDSRYPLVYNGYNPDLTPLAAPYNNLFTQGVTNYYKEWAVYGNATYYITNRLDLTGGIRYASDKQSGIITLTGAYGIPPVNLQSSDSKILYQANLRWRPSDDLSLFFRTATGYRPGGPQNNPGAPSKSFQPDTVTDYELGAKASLFDRHLSLEATLYYMDWRDVQLNGLISGITFVANGGTARVKGIELQANYQAAQGLTLGTAFGYNHAELETVGTAAAASIGAQAGDRLPASPRVTFSAYGDYSFPLSDKVKGSVGATVRYQGDQVSAFSLDPVNVFHVVPDYTTVDLRTSLSFGRYTLRAIVQNVTDKNGYSGYFTGQIIPGQGTPSQAYLIRPRTFSLSASVDF